MSIYTSGIADIVAVSVLSFLIGYGFPRAEWLKYWQEKIIKLIHNYFVR
jgi:hypothetical protein